MFQRQLKWLLGAAVLATNAVTLHAQMAQDPLLSRTASVEPNIVFIFDDSASMASTAIYQYGIGAGYQGSRGPNGDAECLSGSSCIWTNPPKTYYGRSPDVNLIYYDPRVSYKLRVKADGSFMTAGDTTLVTGWDVYFYKANDLRYNVTNVTVATGGSGYPATPPALPLIISPSSATPATGSATTAATYQVSGVSITDGGQYTSNPDGLAVTFGVPGSPNVRAAGTVTGSTFSNGVTAIANTSFSTNNATSTTCSVNLTNAGAGTGFAATAVLPAGNKARNVTITVTSPGSGYASTTAATVTCASAKSATVTLTPVYTINNVQMTETGLGYNISSPPSVTFPPGTVTATGTATLAATNYVNSISFTGGTGYSVCPSVVVAGGTVAATFNVTCPAPTTLVGVNQQWDGTLNQNGQLAGKGPVSKGDYFTPNYPPDVNSPLATGALALNYPNSPSSSTTQYPKFRNRIDCASNYCTWQEEQQNYANWQTYHSNRLDLAKTGIGLAFQPLNPTFRLGWGTLGGISGKGSTGSQCGNSGTGALTQGVRLYNSGTQSDFLTWLYNIKGNVLCTPSRFALDNVGKYYQRADAGGPWSNSPDGTGTISVSGVQAGHASCRRSYSMLMTDGYYNDDNASPAFTLGSQTDWDSTAGPTISQPRGYQYAPVGPYSDVRSGTPYSDSLADVAMKYWVQDLRPDLGMPNSVKPVRGDEAFWQHMNFYAIGLGLLGTIDATNPAVLQALTGSGSARTMDWPAAPAPDAVGAIDDMYHATVNGRGKLLNAKTADELNKSVQQMMSEIGGKEGTQSGVAVSTISLTSSTRKYTPEYTPISWTGNVTAYKLDAKTAVQLPTPAWEVETEMSTDPVTGVKTYATLIPPYATRKIFVGNGQITGVRAVPFTLNDMSTAGVLSSMGTGITSTMVDYLRGAATNEDNSATTASSTAIYRARQTRLGDIVNSTPVFVRNTLDMGYDKLPSIGASYTTFQAIKKARPEGVLFVGANDGMLHAFRDGTYDVNGSALTQGGIEVFAYVPNALLPALTKLADKAYVHRYYVDGPNTEADAYLTSRGGWTNIVLGSTGAGAGVLSSSGVSPRSAVFAIDTTIINSNPAGLTASNVMWEVSSNLSGFGELGYVLTDIQSGVTINGDWIAVFGNGYESKSCQASLFVVNLETGALIKEIQTGKGSCGVGTKNGLGGVRLVRNGSNQVIGAYAGDLLGNLWKFNLNATSSGSWGLDLANKPLMTTGTSQPITAQPSVLPLPIVGTTDPKPGYMVVFGTGKFYEVPDISTTATQSVYGIWDKLPFGTSTIPTGSALIDTSLLVQQSIGAAQTTTTGNTFFNVSHNTVAYTGASAKRGWFINLPNTGQRLIYPLDVLADRFAVADTISPANVSTDPCSNSGSGTGYLYVIDALDGSGPTKPILDTNGDNNVDSGDLVVSGIQGAADGRNVNIVVSKDDTATVYANVGGGAPGATIIRIGCELTNTCAIPSPGVRHQWRQLFLR